MGQAAVDLPDPMQDGSTAHAGGADDLLAQLAGDEIDRLLAESDVEKPAAPAPTPAQPQPVQAAVPATAVEPMTTPVETAAAAPTASAPSLPLNATDVLNANPLVDAAAALSPRVPIWLKPLQWINSPLDAGPASLRDTVGKVAILTLVNALAVLAYVALFRRHH